MTLWYYDQAYWQCVRPWFHFLLSTQYILVGWSSSQKPGLSGDPNHPNQDWPAGVTLYDFDHIWSVDDFKLLNLIKPTKMKTRFCLFDFWYQYEWEITRSYFGFGGEQKRSLTLVGRVQWSSSALTSAVASSILVLHWFQGVWEELGWSWGTRGVFGEPV